MAIARALACPRPRSLEITVAGRTTVGRRDHNEDAFVVRTDLGLVVLADGMGGYAGGALASQLTVDAVARSFEDDADTDGTKLAAQAHASVLLAHRSVRAQRKGPLAQMGSTVVVFAFRDGTAAVAHAGDSRLYLCRGGVVRAMTRDHSFMEEMALRAETSSELEHMRAQWGHVVTRAIGHGETLVPDVTELRLLSGDVLLLCSDGLHGVVGEGELAHALTTFDPDDACEVLLARAIEVGSRDNVTACVVRVV